MDGIAGLLDSIISLLTVAFAGVIIVGIIFIFKPGKDGKKSHFNQFFDDMFEPPRPPKEAIPKLKRWICPYCRAQNNVEDLTCKGCIAPKDSNAKVIEV